MTIINIPALICQIDQTAGSLNEGGMVDSNTDDLRSLASSLEVAINVVYGEIRHRIEREHEANPQPARGPARGMLDGLLPSNKGR
ncbi:hypothetical protein [Bradyrhizobium elkanii]